MDFILSTDIRKNMRSLVFFYGKILVFSFLFPFALLGIEPWEKKIWQNYTVENFENFALSPELWKNRSYKNESRPDVRITENFTAPIPGSRRALLFRFQEGNNIAGMFVFPKPIAFREFLRELEFPIYSSKSGGSLSVLLQTHDFETKKIFLTNLNYRGWRTISLGIRGRIDQNDPVLNSNLEIRLIGIVYEPHSGSSPTAEILVGVDDIRATVRKKYIALADPSSLLE